MNTNAEKAPMEFRKLKPEEHELLLELLEHPGMSALMGQLGLCASAQESDVLRFSLDADTERPFLLLKARAEGARKLVRDFQSLLEKLKKAKSE